MKTILLSILLALSCHLYSQQSQNVELLYHWSEDSLEGSLIFDNTYNEVWGIMNQNREYAIIGSTEGTHFFDITEINNVNQVAFVAGKVQGPQIIHRDYHDFKNYLYAVSDEGASSLQIIDFSSLPDSVTLVYDSSDLFERSHNIFIDTATAKLYTTNGDIYSLENPLSPELIFSTSLLSCHDMYVKNDTAYINKGNQGFFVVDFSLTSLDNQSFQTLGTLSTYPDQGYNHSGWLSSDGNYYVMADETWGMRMKMLDVSDFTNMEVVSLFGSNVDENSIPHNQIINGNYLYTAYYHDGLYIHDISNPSNPILIGYYDTFTPNHHNSYMGAWGVYPFFPSGNIIVSDMQTGLYVFDVNYDNPLSNDYIEEPAVNVYPNPTKDFLIIQNLLKTNNTIELIDFNGKNILKLNNINNSTSINTSSLAKGLYVLKITNFENVTYHKIELQ